MTFKNLLDLYKIKTGANAHEAANIEFLLLMLLDQSIEIPADRKTKIEKRINNFIYNKAPKTVLKKYNQFIRG